MAHNPTIHKETREQAKKNDSIIKTNFLQYFLCI